MGEVDVLEWVKLGGWAASTIYLVTKGIPQMFEYMDKRNKEKDAALSKEQERYDRDIKEKDAAIHKLIQDHESRNDRKDKQITLLTDQVIKESEENRKVVERAINSMASFKAQMPPLIEIRGVLKDQISRVNELIIEVKQKLP